MILIFGGAYQGKTKYALERFNITENDIHRIDKWILELLQTDTDIDEAVQKFIDENPNAVMICGDISCGVVPIDPIMRKWRETVGRTLAKLSQKSNEVIRLFCGIPTKIK